MNKQILYQLSIDKKCAMTLIELLVAIALMGVLVVGISSLATYAQFHLVAQDRGMIAQNESAYIMEHIAKNITGWGTRGGAIGNVNNPAVVIRTLGVGTFRSLGIKVDWNANGRWDGPPPGPDRIVGYEFKNPGFDWCTDCGDRENCQNCASGWIDFSARVEDIDVTLVSNQLLEINLAACWDRTEATDLCGTPGNPSSTLSARIKMPSTSSN